ncbi:MAG: InlB B-repeat-containing protein [Clostridia bacterium]|nr:InlB B-repeat-containing protein [Clostridia bacterium]
MSKHIKFIAFVIIIAMLFTVSVFASAENKITYDYTSAASRAEYIVNPNPASYTDSTEYSLKDASCDGFEFAGWFTDSECTTQVTALDDLSGDITLYAQWYEMSYSISYVLTTPGVPVSASDVSNPNVHVRLASEEVFLSEPSYIDSTYTFDGWYLDESYTEKIEIIDEFTCSDITLYAHWINTEFEIRYEMGEVENGVYPVINNNPDRYIYNTEIILTDAYTDDPAYSFEGWYTDAYFTEKADSIPAGTRGEVTLYANWIKTEYNITYILADNSGISADSITNPNGNIRTADKDFFLSAPETTDKSFKFVAWYTSPDFASNTRVSRIKAGVTEDVTLYAKWDTAVYSITYDLGSIDTRQSGIINDNPDEYRFGDTINLSDATADGFIFNCWCTDAALKNPVSAITPDMYGDITLYADITEKTYSITYIVEDKEVKASQVVNTSPTVRTTSERTYFDDARTINTEYKFGGWYYDKEFTQEATFVRAYTAENVTVYAKWIKIASYLPVWGDVNLSEELSAADARIILRYAAGLETAFDEIQLRLADLNNDTKVNAADARLALRLSAGLEKEEELIEKYSLPEILLEDGEIIFK